MNELIQLTEPIAETPKAICFAGAAMKRDFWVPRRLVSEQYLDANRTQCDQSMAVWHVFMVPKWFVAKNNLWDRLTG